MKVHKSSQSAFTLIELLVVIGIIGVLSAVMLGVLSRSGDAARATQCMTNMRGLAVSALNYAMQGDGHFPAAGSFKYTDYTGAKVTYPTRKGWISWGRGDNVNSKSCPTTINFDEGNRELLLYAITNGCVWSTGGKTETAYRCPTHDAACLKASKRHPGWSYVMNESFYWNSEGKPVRGWRAQSHGGLHPYDTVANGEASRPPDKVLLFAEIQGLNDAKRGLSAITSGRGNTGDSVLQYKTENESIGFNHAQSGGKLAGHVAFADGHVEKLMYPASGNAQQLTKWLCSGREVSFNGSAYQDLRQ